MTHVLNSLPKSHYLYEVQEKKRTERLAQLRRWLPVLQEIRDRRARELYEELKDEMEGLGES